MNANQHIRIDVRRRPEGPIDFDFYRTRAAALRRQAMRGAAALHSACAIIIATVGVLAGFLLFTTATKPPNSDIKLTDAAEREIEQHLMFGRHQKFR